MLDLDTKVKISAIKIMISLVFEIDGNNKYIKIALIKQTIMVLFQAIIVKSEIRYLKLIMFVVQLIICASLLYLVQDYQPNLGY